MDVNYTIQLIAYKNLHQAEKYINKLPKSLKDSAYIVKQGNLYKIRLFYTNKKVIKKLSDELRRKYKFKDFIIVKSKINPCKTEISNNVIMSYCSNYSPKVATFKANHKNRITEINIDTFDKEKTKNYNIELKTKVLEFDKPVKIKNVSYINIKQGIYVDGIIYPVNNKAVVEIKVINKPQIEYIKHEIVSNIPEYLSNNELNNAYIRIPLSINQTKRITIKLNSRQIRPYFIASNNRYTYIELHNIKLKKGKNKLHIYLDNKVKLYEKEIYVSSIDNDTNQNIEEKIEIETQVVNNVALLEFKYPKPINRVTEVKIEGLKLYSYRTNEWQFNKAYVEIKNGIGYLKIKDWNKNKLEVIIDNVRKYIVLPSPNDDVITGNLDINNKENFGNLYVSKSHGNLYVNAIIRNNKLSDKTTNSIEDKDIITGQNTEETIISKNVKNVIDITYKYDNNTVLKIEKDNHEYEVLDDELRQVRYIPNSTSLSLLNKNYEITLIHDNSTDYQTFKLEKNVENYLKYIQIPDNVIVRAIYIQKIDIENGDIIENKKILENIDFEVKDNRIILFQPLISNNIYRYKVFVFYERYKKANNIHTQLGYTKGNTKIYLNVDDKGKSYIHLNSFKKFDIYTSSDKQFIFKSDNVYAKYNNNTKDKKVVIKFDKVKVYHVDDRTTTQDKITGFVISPANKMTFSIRTVNNKIQTGLKYTYKNITVSFNKSLTKNDKHIKDIENKDNIALQWSSDILTIGTKIGKDFKRVYLNTNIKNINISSAYQKDNISSTRNRLINRITYTDLEFKGIKINPTFTLINENDKTNTYTSILFMKRNGNLNFNITPEYNGQKFDVYSSFTYEKNSNTVAMIVDSKSQLYKLMYSYRNTNYNIYANYINHKNNNEAMIRISDEDKYLSFNKNNKFLFAMTGKRFSIKNLFEVRVGLGTFLNTDSSYKKILTDIELSRIISNNTEFYVNWNNLPLKVSNFNFGLRLSY